MGQVAWDLRTLVICSKNITDMHLSLDVLVMLQRTCTRTILFSGVQEVLTPVMWCVLLLEDV